MKNPVYWSVGKYGVYFVIPSSVLHCRSVVGNGKQKFYIPLCTVWYIFHVMSEFFNFMNHFWSCGFGVVLHWCGLKLNQWHFSWQQTLYLKLIHFFGDEICTVMDEYDCAFVLTVQGVYDIWDKMRHTLNKSVKWKLTNSSFSFILKT